jgi:hypothetical protein
MPILRYRIPDHTMQPPDRIPELRLQKPAHISNITEIAHQVTPVDHHLTFVTHLSPKWLEHRRITAVNTQRKIPSSYVISEL